MEQGMLMENGLLYQIGHNVHWLVVEESRFYNEFANPRKLKMGNLVLQGVTF